MNERIKKLRKALSLTQQEFANRLNIGRGTLANYEVGRNEPIDAVISLICREFNVSEAWLRTGEGEMFVQREEDAVERLCAELHASELEAGIIRAYFRIDSRLREPFIQRLIREMQAEYPSPSAPAFSPGDEAEADEFAALAREQFLSEKQQASQASSVKKFAGGATAI